MPWSSCEYCTQWLYASADFQRSFVPYVLAEIPSNALLKHFKPHVWRAYSVSDVTFRQLTYNRPASSTTVHVLVRPRIRMSRTSAKLQWVDCMSLLPGCVTLLFYCLWLY